MTGQLVATVAVICIVLLPLMVLWDSKGAAGAAGVLSGGAITYFLERSGESWGFALAMMVLAAVFYLIGLIQNSNLLFWVAFVLGVFGSLLPVLLGLEQRVNPGAMTIPWGWILVGVLVLFGLAAMLGAKKKT